MAISLKKMFSPIKKRIKPLNEDKKQKKIFWIVDKNWACCFEPHGESINFYYYFPFFINNMNMLQGSSIKPNLYKLYLPLSP